MEHERHLLLATDPTAEAEDPTLERRLADLMVEVEAARLERDRLSAEQFGTARARLAEHEARVDALGEEVFSLRAAVDRADAESTQGVATPRLSQTMPVAFAVAVLVGCLVAGVALEPDVGWVMMGVALVMTLAAAAGRR